MVESKFWTFCFHITNQTCENTQERQKKGLNLDADLMYSRA